MKKCRGTIHQLRVAAERATAAADMMDEQEAFHLHRAHALIELAEGNLARAKRQILIALEACDLVKVGEFKDIDVATAHLITLAQKAS
jgi:hypothetical protein